ncbi:MAG: glutamine--fructose-6-phosphate transaminase (isomerizing) [Lysobacterales bacterium]
MCGIVGAIAQRDVELILTKGLSLLEYRGYDSAGVALVNTAGEMGRRRTVGKVSALIDSLRNDPLTGSLGLAHTRWATHGAPTQQNAHPHMSGERIALVHNGIIENHKELRSQLESKGVVFESETDSEVAAHLVHQFLEENDQNLVQAVRQATQLLRGAYALAVIDRQQPDKLVCARLGSPLVIGVGLGEHFLASDARALLPVTQRFAFLEEGDVAVLERHGFAVTDADGQRVEREVGTSKLSLDGADKGAYRHYMQKEIHEQPEAIASTLEGRVSAGGLVEQGLGAEVAEVLANVRYVHIVACGTSYHAGLVAKYWIEALAGVGCAVEISSEFRYRTAFVPQDTLFLVISQSGETADTLAALSRATELGYLSTMCICNVPESSMVRAAKLSLMTRAGQEIGVASTKAFTSQLCALFLLTLHLAKAQKPDFDEGPYVRELVQLPGGIRDILQMENQIAAIAEHFIDHEHALYLGRGPEYPVAMEGALKLKEISYIHAEAYAAGELKHGPLALVDESLPVIVCAPSNDLLEKLISNLQEVKARGGKLYLFADQTVAVPELDQLTVITLPSNTGTLSPVLHTIPLQLLAYHVAVLRGTDVDQPRNLAKSVTVE